MRTILLFTVMVSQLQAQQFSSPAQLFEQYDSFKESSISHRRFKHRDIQVLIDDLVADSPFQVKTIGHSIEGRKINMLSIGSGKTSVLLWSQMHGDEPTATMAILDIFNFFKQEGKAFDDFKKMLLTDLTLHFIPMLNPDGAEKYQRRNTIDIDLNRDALRLQCPESYLLKKMRDSLQADWGFNLHDQNRYYGAGPGSFTASMSFLAPAYNYEKEINEVRGDAMRLIAWMNGVLQNYIPDRIGRYSDDFEPRAFGDNMQKWGTRTILIESGGLKNDLEKQTLRKLHFVLLLSSFEAIARQKYKEQKLSGYRKIPFNESNAFHDIIIREARIVKSGKPFMIDIALRRNEITINAESGDGFVFKSRISDIGDLSTSHAYEEWNVKDYEVLPGKTYPRVFRNMAQLHDKKLDSLALLSAGYTDILVKKGPGVGLHYTYLRTRFSQDIPSNKIALGENPSLIFKKDGKVKYVLINGFLYNLEALEKSKP